MWLPVYLQTGRTEIPRLGQNYSIQLPPHRIAACHPDKDHGRFTDPPSNHSFVFGYRIRLLLPHLPYAAITVQSEKYIGRHFQSN